MLNTVSNKEPMSHGPSLCRKFGLQLICLQQPVQSIFCPFISHQGSSVYIAFVSSEKIWLGSSEYRPAGMLRLESVGLQRLSLQPHLALA